MIYFDAFGARTQPELWIDDCFTPMVEQLNPGGVFVTYSAKGSVRRALENWVYVNWNLALRENEK